MRGYAKHNCVIQDRISPLMLRELRVRQPSTPGRGRRLMSAVTVVVAK